MIYLDYNASVPLRPQAKEAMLGVLDFEGNSSSSHGIGRKMRSLIDEVRKGILQSLGAKKLVFTSGGTEANALVLSGMNNLPVLVSTIEHNSILQGAKCSDYVPVTKEGVVNLESLEKKLESSEKTGLISIMLVNNETGVIQPVKEVARIAHLKGWKVHTDASQALGHIPFSFYELDVDMMTLSSHKCGGPVGVGALLLKEDLHLEPLIRGGGQEYGMRSGTLSAPLIVGFKSAMEAALQEESLMAKKLHNFQEKIEGSLPEAIVYGKGASRVYHVSCLGMPRVPSDLQLMSFDLKGVAVSAGAACSSGKIKESHVLAAMGVPAYEAQCAIRASFGWKTKESDIDTFIQVWKDIYSKQFLKEALHGT